MCGSMGCQDKGCCSLLIELVRVVAKDSAAADTGDHNTLGWITGGGCPNGDTCSACIMQALRGAHCAAAAIPSVISKAGPPHKCTAQASHPYEKLLQLCMACW
jgi:hydroxyethylthiazole kinase-like sugar kinase family protein